MQYPEPAPDPHDAKRDAVLHHARRVFLREGYAGTRIEPIATDARISTATLYAFFDGKDVLFSAVIEDSAAKFLRMMPPVRTAGGPAPERLAVFALAYATFMADPFIRSIVRLVLAERRRVPDVAVHLFERCKADFGKALIDVLDELADQGQLRIERASWAAGQLMGMIEHPVLFMPMVVGDEVMPVRAVEQIASDAVETFLARYGAEILSEQIPRHVVGRAAAHITRRSDTDPEVEVDSR